MSKISITPLANDDLTSIRDYIFEDNPEAATKQMQVFRSKCDLLAQSPDLGTKQERYLNLHMFPVGKYLIFYRPTVSGIEVVRVLHSARDISSLLL